MLYIYTDNVLSLLHSSHKVTLAVLAPAMDVENLGAAGRFAAVTDGEINRLDNRLWCTCRRKETNEQTHNYRRVIYTNHLDVIMTADPVDREIALQLSYNIARDLILYEIHDLELAQSLCY